MTAYSRCGRTEGRKLGARITSHGFCSIIQEDVITYVAGEESYVALDKGAITDSHVLVLPIEHFPSSLHLSASTFAEMERYLSALRSCFASQVLSSCQRHPMLGDKQFRGPVCLRSDQSGSSVPCRVLALHSKSYEALQGSAVRLSSSGFYELCRLCRHFYIAKYEVTMYDGGSTHAGEGDGGL